MINDYAKMMIGSIVQLKSGGPRMTVTAGHVDETVTCTWFHPTEHQYPLQHKFPLSALNMLPPHGGMNDESGT